MTLIEKCRIIINTLRNKHCYHMKITMLPALYAEIWVKQCLSYGFKGIYL